MRSLPKKHAARLIAAVTVALLFYALFLFADMRYCLNDDAILGRAMAGCVGGVAEWLNPYTHVLFSFVIHGLGLLFPAVMWYSAAQLALLAIGSYGILEGVMRAGARRGLPLWGGWLAGLGFLLVFTASFSSAITYTQTVGVLTAAAVWRVLAVDFQDTPARVLRGVAGALGMLLCGYLLRPVAALPGICFWTGALILAPILEKREERSARQLIQPALRGLGLTLAAVLALGAVNALAIKLPGERAYMDWQDARTEAIDYGGFARATDETLASAGWTQNDYQMAVHWFFMDENMSAQKLRAVSAAPAGARGIGERLNAAKTALAVLLHRYENLRVFALLLALLCALAFLCALLRRNKKLWALLAPVGCAGVTVVLLFYLALRGRLPMRAAATVLLPACALAAWLALRELAGFWREGKQGGRWRRCVAMAASLCCAAVAAGGAYAAFTEVFGQEARRTDEQKTAFARLESYALAHPELLLIGDNALDIDRELFPDWSLGKPANLLPIYGSWNNHSPGYRAVLASFGYDHQGFQVTDFLNANIRLVSSLDAPPDGLMAYLRERAGGEIAVEAQHTEAGFTVFRLWAAEAAHNK